MNSGRVEGLIRELLKELGEDPDREGLRRTPERVARAYKYMFRGYRLSPAEITRRAIFQQESNNMIILRDIELFSMCEHHILPFFGRCHVAYISRGKVVGVSKIARLVDCFSRRLQIQERLTGQIARALMEAVDAEGVGVVMECRHLCMMMRGVGKQESLMTTSSVLGSFHASEATRAEFLNLIGKSGNRF